MELAPRICTQTGMTIIGIGSAYMSFTIYGILSQITPILEDYCPYVYKYLPKIPTIQKAFDIAKESIAEGIKWIESNLKLPGKANFQQKTNVSKIIEHILSSAKDFTSGLTTVKEVLEHAKKLDIVKNYCNDSINTLKTSALAFGILSSIVTFTNLMWNAYFLYNRRKYPALLLENPYIRI